MKLYKFYKIPNDEALENSDDLEIQYKYPLYAFTNDKKLYDRFKSERCMDNFYIRKSNITDTEYTEFANTYNGSILKDYKYTHNTLRGYESINIVSTWYEKEAVSSFAENCYTDDANMDYNFNMFILTSKYFNLLKSLEFLNFWALYGHPMNKFMGQITEEEFEYYINGSYPEVTYDEFNIFIYIFGELFFKRGG